MTERAERRRSLPGLFARGMAMGVAEVIPGVSGGTIAFVTGIYDELVRSLASLSHRSPGTLLRRGWRAFAQEHNVVFFAVLLAGMVASFLAAASVIRGLLETHGVYVFGFFFGLIAGSVVAVGAEAPWRRLALVAPAGLAAGVAVGLLFEPSAPAAGGGAVYALAGALAATAWILPGVSGSFVLLLLGLYQPLLDALHAGDWATLATFAGGLAAGLLAFSKLLAWLLARARDTLLALLTGFLAGSLTQIWPWRHAVSSAPEPNVLGVVAAMLAGALVVGALAWLAGRRGAAA